MAIAIARRGQTLRVAHQNGFPVGDKSHLWSATKTFAAIEVLKLITDGILPSLDAKVSNYLTAWQGDPVKRETTVRQLLSQQSGLEQLQFLPDLKNETYEESLARPMPAEKVGTWAYGSSSYGALGALYNALVRPRGFINCAHHLREKIFTPLGIDIDWTFVGTNQPALAGGASCTVMDLLRFCEFMRNRGEGLIDPALMDEMRKPSKAYSSYALSLWLTADDIDRAIAGEADPAVAIPLGGYAAIGWQNNLACVIGDVSVARLGKNDTSFNMKRFCDLIIDLQ